MARFQAEENPTFQRAMRLVSAITKGYPAQVTTTIDHDYETGDIVRLTVPVWFGMVQANLLVGTIEVTSTNSFNIDIDTRGFNPFKVPSPVPWYVNSYAQVTPVGEISAKLTSATQNTLPH